MSALSIQVPFPVFQGRDGQPLENGYVWIGEPNLNPQTNPVVAYYDDALTIVAAQPLRTLNGYISRAGTPAQIYIDGVNFSILVQDSKGSMVYNFPEGTGIAASAAGVSYLPAGTGAVVTTVQTKLRESVSVKDFGAVGDGIADDTAAIQAAINATTSTISKIVFPSGTYVVSSTLIINNRNGVYLEGCGFASVLLFTSTTANGITISGTSSRTTISNLWLVASASATAGSVIYISTTSNPALFTNDILINNGWIGMTNESTAGNIYITKFLFSNQNNIGILSSGNIWATTGNINNAVSIGFSQVTGLGPFMSDVDIFGCATGVAMRPLTAGIVGQARFVNVACENGTFGWFLGGSGGRLWSVTMQNCNATGNTARGVHISSDATNGVDGVYIDGIIASGNSGDGITLFGGTNIVINGGFAGGNTSSGISVAGGVSGFQITGVRAGPSGGYNANGAYGIIVNVGVSNNYIVSLNNAVGNTLAGVSDAGTGLNKIVANNLV